MILAVFTALRTLWDYAFDQPLPQRPFADPQLIDPSLLAQIRDNNLP
jgi:hypothetical protein